MKENLTNGQPQKSYSYEVANVELLDDKTERPSNDSQTSEGAVLTISGAKLLKDVEKSYDKGKKLLEDCKSSRTGYLLLSAIMTQANTFEKSTDRLRNNVGYVVKKVILSGNNAYLWSTENGYEFFIEKSYAINSKNYNTINKLLETYGTDKYTESLIDSIQRSEDSKERSRSLANIAKRTRDRANSGQDNRNGQTSIRAGVNGDNVSDTQSEVNLLVSLSGYNSLNVSQEETSNLRAKIQKINATQEIELLSTSQGTIHGFQHNGRIGLFTNEIDPSDRKATTSQQRATSFKGNPSRGGIQSKSGAVYSLASSQPSESECKSIKNIYLHEVILQESLQNESIKTDTKADSHSGDVAKVIQKILSASESSKILDENGEPLVVYHFSDKNFSIFAS